MNIFYLLIILNKCILFLKNVLLTPSVKLHTFDAANVETMDDMVRILL